MGHVETVAYVVHACSGGPAVEGLEAVEEGAVIESGGVA